MSQWVNYAIWRDPSVAQGREYPMRFDGAMAADEMPRPLHIPEDAQEQYFRQYMGGRHFNRAPPNLDLIQQMLEMVKLESPPPRPYNGPKKPPSKSMLNPNCPEFVPQRHASNVKMNDNRSFYQADTNRNDGHMALGSLLEASEDNGLNKAQALKLNKPDDDFMPIDMALKDEYMNARIAAPMRHLMMQQADMVQGKPPMEVKPSALIPVPETNNNTYHFYIYEHGNRNFDHNNIWDEKAMVQPYCVEESKNKSVISIKEIDSSNLKPAHLSTDGGFKEDNLKLDLVRLPYHRHMIAEQCIVCNVVKKHNFDIDKFLSLAMHVYTD